MKKSYISILIMCLVFSISFGTMNVFADTSVEESNETNISSIEFHTDKPLDFIENCGGDLQKEDDGQWYHYNTWNKIFSEGNKIVINGNDEYEYKWKMEQAIYL